MTTTNTTTEEYAAHAHTLTDERLIAAIAANADAKANWCNTPERRTVETRLAAFRSVAAERGL